MTIQTQTSLLYVQNTFNKENIQNNKLSKSEKPINQEKSKLSLNKNLSNRPNKYKLSTSEDKSKSIELVLIGETIQASSKAYNIPTRTLYHWIKNIRNDLQQEISLKKVSEKYNIDLERLGRWQTVNKIFQEVPQEVPLDLRTNYRI